MKLRIILGTIFAHCLFQCAACGGAVLLVITGIIVGTATIAITIAIQPPSQGARIVGLRPRRPPFRKLRKVRSPKLFTCRERQRTAAW